MKLVLELNNKTKYRLSISFAREIALLALKESGWKPLFDNKVSLSMAVVSPGEIRKINRIYRKKDEATDVLSFPEHDKKTLLRNKSEKELFLGEIIVCYNYIKEYCDKNRIVIKKELANVISHSVLHLLGFSHGKKMFLIQDEVVNNFKKATKK